MAYTDFNYRTKKALKEAVARGEKVHCYQPGGIFPLSTGRVALEGPHYPEAHKWYANVTVDESGYIVNDSGVK